VPAGSGSGGPPKPTDPSASHPIMAVAADLQESKKIDTQKALFSLRTPKSSPGVSGTVRRSEPVHNMGMQSTPAGEEPEEAEDGTHVPCRCILIGGQGHGPSIAIDGVLGMEGGGGD